MAIEFGRVTPVLRMFDVTKAREFYLDFLGFSVDWEHRHEPGTPLYMQLSRGSLVLHLSEHHGDGSPGVVIQVEVRGLDEFHREVTSKGYKYMRPGIEPDYSGRTMGVIDPSGNRIRFHESTEN